MGLKPRWLVVASMLGLAPVARADFFAHTCRVGPTGGAVLKLTEGNPTGGGQPCGGFEVRVRGKRISKGRLGFPGSGVFLSTSDGRSVIFVQSSPYIWERDALARTPGVVFFRDGKQVASYTIAELVERPQAVIWSVSHAHWVAGPDEGQGDPFALPEATWTLHTRSLRRITFDTESGRILRAEDAPPWNECDIIATGQVVDGSHGLEFSSAFPIKGSLAARVPLPSGLGLLEHSLATLCLANGADGVRVVRKIGRR